ncbi:MAG: hypothetical protein WAO55_13690 [Candidatus Manganitrophaceae bacterium]
MAGIYESLTTEQLNKKYPKQKKEIKLVGVDVYVITEKGIPKFDEIAGFKCEFISNRGTKVWPGFVSPDLLIVNWYRCRFMATGPVTDADINRFLDELTGIIQWSAAQKLWNHGGEAAYSKAY